MKRIMILIAALAVAIVLSVGLVACDKSDGEKEDSIDAPIKAQGIALTASRIAMTKGSQTTLTYQITPGDATGTPTYESSDAEVAQVDDRGIVTAKGAGFATLTVRLDDKYAECRVVVGDLIVAQSGEREETAASLETGTVVIRKDEGNEQEDAGEQIVIPQATLIQGAQGKVFGTLQAAVSAATSGQTIVVDEGTYDERPTIDKDLVIMGINNPVFSGATVTAGRADLTNLTLSSSNPPSEGSATLHVKSGASAKVTNCTLTVSDATRLEGGYAVLAEQNCALEMCGNTLSNYRYGIYVCPTDKTIDIRNNRLSNMQTGIGVDVRQPNSDMDYPASGQISGNQYNEVERHTQFLHYAGDYDGDLDFEDNEEENASQGQTDTGGSGLME